jgi:hypothetical protein
VSKYHQRRLLLRLRGVRENGSGVYGGGGALRHLPAAATNSVSDLPARMALRQSEYVVMKPGTARGRSTNQSLAHSLSRTQMLWTHAHRGLPHRRRILLRLGVRRAHFGSG